MKIGVIGAYGFTGRLICDELDKAKLLFCAIGRSKEKLEYIRNKFENCTAILVADITLEEGINSVLNSVDVIVNCAGPFTEESKGFIKAVAYSGKFYLDITGENGFIKHSFEAFDSITKRHNTLIIHGCAFESMIVDIVSNNIISKETMAPSSLKSFYRFSSKRVSPGTRTTMKLAKYRDILKIKEGNWVAFNNSDKLKVRIENEELAAVPYPLPELNYWSSLYSHVSAESYLIMDIADAKFINIYPKVEGDAREELKEIKSRINKSITEDQRAEQRCDVFLCIDYKNGMSKMVHINAKDMYSITAKCILHSILKFSENKEKPVGVVTPSLLFSGNKEKIMADLEIKSKRIEQFQL